MKKARSIRFDDQLIEEITKIAKEEDRTFSSMVRIVLKKTVKHKELILSLK